MTKGRMNTTAAHSLDSPSNPPLKFVLVADIHGNLAALEAVAADIRRRGVECVANLGDSLSGPLLPRETAQFLMDRGWLSLAGNHERQLLAPDPEALGPSDAYALDQLTAAELDWLRALPPTARLSPEVFLCHGTPGSDLEYFLESVADGRVRPATAGEVESRLGAERAEVVACGHTHLARVLRSRHGQLLINPGSVGLPAYDWDVPEPHVVEAGSPDARYAVVERVADQWVVSLIAVPYDPRPMAELARRRGRPDWGRALLTGYVT
jgi:predicted phosphodiesterase